MSKLSVLDIKLEIARRLERMTTITDHSLATQGAVQELALLWKWITTNQEEEEG